MVMAVVKPLLGLMHPMTMLTEQNFAAPAFVTMAYFSLGDAFIMQQVCAPSYIC